MTFNDFDYENEVLVPYQSPVTLETQLELPENGEFSVLVCTTKDRWVETLSMIRLAAIVLELAPVGSYNIDLYKAMETVTDGCTPMITCDDIEACLATSPLFAQLAAQVSTNTSDITYIQEVSNSQQIPPDTPQYDNRFPPALRNQPISTTDISDGMGGCDNDKLWAAIREVVNRVNDLARDLLEILVSEADTVQRAATFVESVPFVGDIASSVLNAAAENADDIRNLYESYVTASVLEDIACDLFCMVVDECRFPTFNEYIDYYKNLGIIDIQDLTQVAFQFMVDVIFNSSGILAQTIFYSMNVFVLFTMYLDGEVLGRRGKRWLDIWANAGANSPDNDWTLLCEDCATEITEFCYDWDFSNGLGLWQLIDDNGILSGGGIQSEFNLNNQKVSSVFIDAGESYVWGGVEILYNWSGTSSSGDTIIVRGYDTFQPDGTNTGQVTMFSATNAAAGSDILLCIPDDNVGNQSKRYLRLILININAGSADEILIKRIRLFKTAVPPLNIESNGSDFTC